jgi:ABC-type transport system substrate-binding protein
MSNPVCMALPVSLCVCCDQFMHRPSSLAEPWCPPELNSSGAKFGGIYRRMLATHPSTLDPTQLSDIYGGAVEEIFAELLQRNLEETIIPSAMAEEIRADPKYRQYQRVRMSRLSLSSIGLNTPREPFVNRLVRQAFNVPLVHSTSRTNRTFYGNPLVDQLLEQARREPDENRRIAFSREVERLVMEDAL